MKNIHLLPTDKPSRLLYSGNNKNLLFSKEPISFRTFERSPQNIYITSDEEIKEGDWFLVVGGIGLAINTYHKSYGDPPKNDWLKKIILTTDPDLINDGVQAIDDEFLEWFVKNPSCERVETAKGKMKLNDDGQEYGFPDMSKYKITIPQEEPKQNCKNCNQLISKYGCACGKQKEEPKQIKCYCGHTITCDCEPLQETLEEVAENYAKIYRCPATNYNEYCKHDIISAINFGAKWQQERMYSEEDMIEFAEFVATYPDKNKNINGQILHAKSKYDGSERTVDLLEQFKKNKL